MRIIELLEAKSAPLYHGTDLYNATKIVQSNILGRHPKEVVSLSRSLEFSKFFAQEKMNAGGPKKNIVVFELDQLRLAQNYKIEPYHDEFSIEPGEDPALFRTNKWSNQMEEAVHGAIKPLSRYLTRIIVPSTRGLPEIIAKHHLLFDESTNTFPNRNFSRPPSIDSRVREPK